MYFDVADGKHNLALFIALWHLQVPRQNVVPHHAVCLYIEDLDRNVGLVDEYLR